MARILGHIVLVITAILWFLGCSPQSMRWLSQHGWMADDYRYGDLYRFSNLAQFRSLQTPCRLAHPPERQGNTHLVLLGDSFTEEGRLDASDLAFEKLTRLHIAAGGQVQLDTHQRTILVLETVERHFQERFLQPYQQLQVNDPGSYQSNPTESWLDFRLPYNEERHQAFLFSTELFLRIKEWKAWLTHRILGRVDDHVFLSQDEQHIFYSVDHEPGLTNGFQPISEAQITHYVQSLNETYAQYRRLGFDEVYLSIIPNKSSILGKDTGKYNQLVARIQSHPNLNMPFVDMLTPLEKLKEVGFAKGDTHWTCQGQNEWLQRLNSL